MIKLPFWEVPIRRLLVCKSFWETTICKAGNARMALCCDAGHTKVMWKRFCDWDCSVAACSNWGSPKIGGLLVRIRVFGGLC